MKKSKQIIIIAVGATVLYLLLKSEAQAKQSITAFPSTIPNLPTLLNPVQQDYQIVINGPALTN